MKAEVAEQRGRRSGELIQRDSNEKKEKNSGHNMTTLQGKPNE